MSRNTNKTAAVDVTPVPTGKLGGNGEFYFWPESQKYAPMINGQASEPSFDQTTWDAVSAALPSVDVAKASVINAVRKAEVKQTIRQRIKVNFDAISFESDEDLSGDYTLTEIVGLLDRMGYTDPLNAVNGITFTVSKRAGNNTGSIRHGGGSSTFVASTQDQLKKFKSVGDNPKADLWLNLASDEGFDPNKWEEYNQELPGGSQFTSKLNAQHVDIILKKRGVATQTIGGVQFIDYTKNYDGFDVDHLYA